MFRMFLLSGWVYLGLIVPVKADVFIFNKDGSTTEYIVKDYMHKRAKALHISASQKALYSDFIKSAALEYKVDVELIEAVISAESGFNANATSPKGAMGLMQLIPATAVYLGVSDAYDPRQNIEGGTKYLSQLMKDNNGEINLALAAYNAGQSAVNKYGGVPPYRETQEYVEKITNMLAGE